MRRALILGVLAIVAGYLGGAAAGVRSFSPAMAEPPAPHLTVTSAADTGGVCPGATTCTLRRAIEVANSDTATDPFTIDFDPTAFPIDGAATISVGNSPLPVLTRPNLIIDGSAAGVAIRGASQNLAAAMNGLVMAGDHQSVRGLALHHFSAACLSVAGSHASVGGSSARNEGIRAGECSTGVAITGDAALVAGSRIGFAASGETVAPVSIALSIAAGSATIGDDGADPGAANIIGNAATAIRVGGEGGSPFNGVRILRNTIGRDGAGSPAPTTVGIDLRPPSAGTLVSLNTIAYAATGVAVAASSGGLLTEGNRFSQNTFQALTGMAIDLKTDGIPNPNDEGDADAGPNTMLNHPVLTRAVQSRISGDAGVACGGCTVQLYLAAHLPGSPNDYGSIPVAGAAASADSTGTFTFENPAVTSGQWVTALATDAQGNTSEFGPSVRVGAGIVQCGNVSLSRGWNHAGFFGPDVLTLTATFPSAGADAGKVSAIYHLEDGTDNFSHWFASATPARTLDTLVPGEAYWFYAEEPVTISAGFSLSVPLPVALKTGWNDVVYIGASADVRDALGSVAGKYADLYRWNTDLDSPGWARYGDASIPTWAQYFSSLQACGTYELFASDDIDLVPLQP